jgi:PAS domain S-box-containing protein
MMEKLPVPVVTSDQDGRIYFANASVATLAGLSSQELRGQSFFDLFSDKNHQGATIADYLRRFSSPNVNQPLLLRCRGKSYEGATQLMDTISPRMLLIVLTSNDFSEPVKRPF